MVFVGPKLSGDQVIEVLARVWILAHRNKKRFVKVMSILITANSFRLREAQPSVDKSSYFDEMVSNAVSIARYRFTMPQLRELAHKLAHPENGIVTIERDHISRVEALALVCHRLSEAFKLFTL
ncbi:hypothetical protein LEN26_002177 [Aphanomyces euteiches]|nr:hypothetical protein LEN26_002177 [Aphanomyces euteiches]